MRFHGVSAGRRLVAALTVLAALLLSLAPVALADERHDEEGRRGFHVEEGFRDMGEAAWAAKYVTAAQMRALIRGYADQTFRPNQPLSREEAVAMVVRALGLEMEAQGVADQVYNVGLPFQDAGQIGPWAVGYVKVALDEGLIDGGDGMFQPQRAASRTWVIPILVRAMGLESEAQARMNEQLGFTDAAAIPASVTGYISVAIDTGLVNGFDDGTFRPFQPVTRAQMAKLLEVLRGEIEPVTLAPRRYNVRGVIAGVDTVNARLVLKTMRSQPAVYEVAYNAAIYLDNRPARLADLRPGFLAEIFLNEDGRVVFVDANSKPVRILGHLLQREHPREDDLEGVVLTVDPAGLGITVDTERGEVTVPVAPDAMVELPDDGWGTFEDIMVGDLVEVKVRGGIAVKIEVEDAEEYDEERGKIADKIHDRIKKMKLEKELIKELKQRRKWHDRWQEHPGPLGTWDEPDTEADDD